MVVGQSWAAFCLHEAGVCGVFEYAILMSEHWI